MKALHFLLAHLYHLVLAFLFIFSGFFSGEKSKLSKLM